MVFDRNKGSIYSVYNRALRKDPTLQGKVVLKLTIAPSGKVTHCSLVSSELDDAALGSKITSRVKRFDFGAKEVAEVTITYPIDFLPA
jgi:TonB family protein